VVVSLRSRTVRRTVVKHEEASGVRQQAGQSCGFVVERTGGQIFAHAPAISAIQ
jgi:hypothetical protein